MGVFKMKYYYFIVILFVSMINLASAEQQSLGVFKQGEIVIIQQTCSNCTYVNFTSLTFPNSTQKIIEIAMTKSKTKYNASFSDTQLLGNYIVTTCGDVDAVLTCVDYDFDVTVTGKDFTTGQGILYIVFAVTSILLFVLVLYGALKIPFKNTKNEESEIININDLKYVKILCWVLSYLILMSIFGLLRGTSASYISEIGVHRLFNWLYFFMLAFVYPLIVSSLIFALIFFIQDKKWKKDLERGIPLR